MLKRVLLAYARWNKDVGYCQGFNVIAALILDVMDRKEDDTLKVQRIDFHRRKFSRNSEAFASVSIFNIFS